MDKKQKQTRSHRKLRLRLPLPPKLTFLYEAFNQPRCPLFWFRCAYALFIGGPARLSARFVYAGRSHHAAYNNCWPRRRQFTELGCAVFGFDLAYCLWHSLVHSDNPLSTLPIPILSRDGIDFRGGDVVCYYSCGNWWLCANVCHRILPDVCSRGKITLPAWIWRNSRHSFSLLSTRDCFILHQTQAAKKDFSSAGHRPHRHSDWSVPRPKRVPELGWRNG